MFGNKRGTCYWCWGAVLISLFFLPGAGTASDQTALPTAGSTAGFVVQRDGDDSDCSLFFHGLLLATLDCSASMAPELIGYFPLSAAEETTELLVVQEMPRGNACNGGPLHLFQVTGRKSVTKQDSIDFCGGRSPEFRRQGDGVFITLPGGPINRGEDTLPTEIYRLLPEQPLQKVTDDGL